MDQIELMDVPREGSGLRLGDLEEISSRWKAAPRAECGTAWVYSTVSKPEN